MNVDRLLPQQQCAPSTISAVSAPHRLGSSGTNLRYVVGSDAVVPSSPKRNSDGKGRRGASPRRRKQTEASKRGKRLGGKQQQQQRLSTIPMLFSVETTNGAPIVKTPKQDPPGVLSEELPTSIHKVDLKELGAFLSSGKGGKSSKRSSTSQQKVSKTNDPENTTVVNWMRCSDSVDGSAGLGSTFVRDTKPAERKKKKKRSGAARTINPIPTSSNRADDFDQTSTTTSSSRRSEEHKTLRRHTKSPRKESTRSTSQRKSSNKSLSSNSASSSSQKPNKVSTRSRVRPIRREEALQESFHIEDLALSTNDVPPFVPDFSGSAAFSDSRKSSIKSSSLGSSKEPKKRSVAEAAAASARARGRPAYSDKSATSAMQQSLRIEDLEFPTMNENDPVATSSSQSSGHLSISTATTTGTSRRLSTSGRRLSMVKGGSGQASCSSQASKPSSPRRKKQLSAAPIVCAVPLDFSEFDDDDFSVQPAPVQSSRETTPFAKTQASGGAIEWL